MLHTLSTDGSLSPPFGTITSKLLKFFKKFLNPKTDQINLNEYEVPKKGDYYGNHG